MCKLNEIQINYDDEKNLQIETLKQAVNLRNLWHTRDIIETIYCSYLDTTMEFLTKYKFRRKNHYSYRVTVVNRLKERNKKLVVKTNKKLWLYLEYFTDITDFSECFDIKVLDIKDGE